jgi:DNA-directed RNA polymerase sigma subunit (sigma70/sigma32)
MEKDHRDVAPENGMTFSDIAKVLGISRQRVQQIYRSALWKLSCNPQLQEAARQMEFKTPYPRRRT